MIEHRISLAQGGAAILADHGNALQFGYSRNCRLYRLRAACKDEWAGLSVRVFWHLPDGSTLPPSLLVDHLVDVPARVTAQPGEGWVTFEGSDGTQTVTSADVRYHVSANHGTEDPTMPEPGTPAWQEFIRQVRQMVGAGLSETEKSLMLTLFQNAAYSSSKMQNIYSQLAALWGSGTVIPDPTPDNPDVPDVPDTPDTPAIIPVTSVHLNKTTLSLTEGASETLTATVLPANATNKTVSWTVSPSGFAAVSAGRVTAVKAGSCTVTAAAGGKSASCAVTVTAVPVSSGEVTVDTAANAGVNRVWKLSDPLLSSNFMPITAKQDFTLKKLDFQLILAAATSLRINLYCLTDKKDIGTPVILAGTEGTFHAVAEFSDVACEAGKEYQIWIEAESACMNYPSVFDSMAGENEYFDTTGTAYRYNNSKIRYLGYVVLEP